MKEIRVVELFAGVGGFRLGLEGWKGKSASSHYTKAFSSPYKVVWSNQWEPSSSRSGELQEANMVYHHNWPDTPESKHYPHDLNSVASPEFSAALRETYPIFLRHLPGIYLARGNSGSPVSSANILLPQDPS